MIHHPSLIYFFGALLVLFVHVKTRQLIQLFVPLAGLYFLFLSYDGAIQTFSLSFAGHIWPLMRIDPLSILFALSFLVFSLLANLFSLDTGSRTLFAAANIYTAGAIGAVLAGDLRILFIFWEIMAIASAVLVWNSKKPESGHALYRYLLMHGFGGLLFLAAIILKLQAGQSLETGAQEMDLAGTLLFAAFAVNAALVPVHTWLPDAYSSATPAGSVYLSAFTTKTAVYAFARMFPGEELLLFLGALAAVYGIIYALMSNDIRRVLSYSTVCQIGYMAAGIGLGTSLGISAGVGHAVGNIFFKGLLFMAAGCIIMATGHSRLSELGGLASKKPFLFFLYTIGALAIAGFPFLNGYITKALLLLSAAEAHAGWLELLFLSASVGTFLSVGLKMGWFIFFGTSRSQSSAQSLPWNCYVAMILAALLCLTAGVFPQLLYAVLPEKTVYTIYTPDHIFQTLQWLAGSSLAFLFLSRLFQVKPLEPLDFDWFYRKGGNLLIRAVCEPLKKGQEKLQSSLALFIQVLGNSFQQNLPRQDLSSAGYALLWIAGGFILSTGAVFFLR